MVRLTSSGSPSGQDGTDVSSVPSHWQTVGAPVGYLSWVTCFLLLLGVAGPLTLAPLMTAVGLGLVGVACLVGYRLTFNPKMKALGIPPRQILGLRPAQRRIPDSDTPISSDAPGDSTTSEVP